MDPKRDPKTRSTDGASAPSARDATTCGPPQNAYCVAHALSDLLTRGCADNATATRSCYTQRGGHVLRILGDSPLASLQLDDVQAFIDQRLAEGAARETIRKELCVLRRALDLAHKRRILASLPEALLPRFRTRYVPKNPRVVFGALPPHSPTDCGQYPVQILFFFLMLKREIIDRIGSRDGN